METSDSDEVVEEVTRPVVKLLVTLIGLKILEFIVVRLPNLGASIPDVPITFRAVAVAIVSLIMAGILVNFGREIEPRLERVLPGPDEIVADVAEIVKLLAFLAAVLVVYDRLGGVVVPFLGDVWIYNVVFLLIALVPTAIVAQRIFGNVEEITDLITEWVKAVTVDEQPGEESTTD